MKRANTSFGLLLASVATALSLTASAALAETKLVLSSWLPPRHPLVSEAIKPWARQVEEVTEGRVSVRILAKPMGAPPAHFDMAAEGIADITYGLHSFTTDDRFLRSRIGQFSFIADDAVSGSKAFWKIYTEQLGAAEEHEGVKVLSLFVHGPGLLSNNIRRIETPDDLAGLKIRTPGGYIADLIGDLGATTLFMSSGEVYEKLTRGVIDGVTFPYDGLAQFKLADYLKYTMSVPGGFYNTTWFLVMNEDKWAEISETDRAAIEAISGEVFAELAGKAWDGSDAQSRAVVEKAGVEIHEATPETLAAIKAAAAGYEAEWAEAVSEGGYDGAAALAELRAQTGVTY
ncbi:TRAP transporter substrate-binding protein [Salipiger sp. P9]|uniref:TRAP transporter substrate-binding protein n=1 Tax=Salipiger pentaromativorans TaxID=2943193 RepID=UPI00215817EF|nr:TRAP transporter substrate-binding protein [Salipiger pentaromativorans]MCR8548875.1 TRAP transporter substrate-binding protein [Salipiger pentaromativorans]